MLDIHVLMQSLSLSRPLFHSEADFQHALAWHIHQTLPSVQLRLEFPVRFEEDTIYIDIWIPSEGIALELKYPTRGVEIDRDGESFRLREQSARDTRRYDFLKDVQRLEMVRAEKDVCKAGYAIILTNDQGYWSEPNTSATPDTHRPMDAAFRIHEGRKIKGELGWHGRPAKGTFLGREKPIHLNGSYTMHWQDYWEVRATKGGRFRYLVVAVQ